MQDYTTWERSRRSDMKALKQSEIRCWVGRAITVEKVNSEFAGLLAGGECGAVERVGGWASDRSVIDWGCNLMFPGIQEWQAGESSEKLSFREAGCGPTQWILLKWPVFRVLSCRWVNGVVTKTGSTRKSRQVQSIDISLVSTRGSWRTDGEWFTASALSIASLIAVNGW